MTAAATISVNLEGRDVSLSSLLQKVDSQTQKAADSALRLQAQYARLSQSQGNSAQATNILTNALLNNGGASERTVVSLSTQLATVERGSGIYQQFGQSAVQSFTGTIGPAAILTAGIGALNAVIGEAQAGFALKASLDADTKAIEIQLNGVRDTGVMFQQAAQYANQYKLTQQQTTEAIGAAIPVIRASSSSMETILGTFDQLRVRAPTKSFQDAARALGELQAGQYVSLNKIFNVPLADAKKLSDEIAKGGDAVQLVSDYLTGVGASMDVVAARASGAAGAMKDLDIASEQLKLALGDDATGPGLLILQTRIRATQGLINILHGDLGSMAKGIHETIVGTTEDVKRLNEETNKLHGIPAPPPPPPGVVEDPAARAAAEVLASQAAQAAQDAYTRSILEGGTQAEATAARVAALAAAMLAGAPVARMAATNFDEDRMAIGALQVATEIAQAAVAAHTIELQTSAQASVLAAAEQLAQKAATDQLSASTTAGVNAFLALNPTLDAAGIAAVGAANNTDPLIIKLAQLRVEAYSARDAIAALAAAQGLNTKVLVGTLSAGSPAYAGSQNNSVDAVVALQTANKKAADDQIAGDLAIAKAKGETAKEVALLRQQQQGLNKDSLEYKTIEASIITASKPKGGGAKATKLSDQQKLNNTLLTDQEKADTQYEDLETQHQQTLLKIQIDFAKKTLEQQKLNEVSKRQSQADFYDRLTSSDLNKKKGGTDALKQIDADYQAAYQKSQELAQAGNAKLAAEYLALKSKQAADELTYQENLAKAAADKDKAEVSRLQAIHKLRQDASAEEEKQLLAGGDANVTAKQQALDDEAAKNQEAQDKIGTSAERAADRQTVAAQRAGKAVDALNTSLATTKSTYDQIAPTAGGSGNPSTSSGAASADTSASASAPAAAGADPISAAIAALQDAISAKLDSVRNAADGTTSAVRGLAGKFAN